MAELATTLRQISPTSWEVSWAATANDPAIYYLWQDGVHIWTTPARVKIFNGVDGDETTIEVFDDAADSSAFQPGAGRMTIKWNAVDDAASYKVQENTGSWVTRFTVQDEGQPDFSWLSDRLADETGFLWRVVPVDAEGNDGTPTTFVYHAMVRRPDTPVVTYSYDSGTAKVTVASAESATGAELFRGVNADPDLTAAPFETISAFPHLTAALAADNTYFFATARRNAWNMLGFAGDFERLDIDAGGDAETQPPGDPDGVTVTQALGGTVNIQANYDKPSDATAVQADTWAIWITSDGSAPDPDNDPADETETMLDDDGAPFLDFTTGAFADTTVIKVVVRTRRLAGTVDSINTAVSTVTIDLTGPDAPTFTTGLGDTLTGVGRVFRQNDNNRVDHDFWETDGTPGALLFYLGGTAVMRIDEARVWITGNLEVRPLDATPVQSDVIEWNAGNSSIVIATGDPLTRALELYPSGNLRVAGFRDSTAFPIVTGLDAHEFSIELDAGDDTIFTLDLSREMARLVGTRFEAKGIRTNATLP